MGMPGPPGQESTAFDAYAGDYDAALNQGLSATGEGKEYFARGRVAWLAARLRRMGFRPRTVLDFGCGTGSSSLFLRDLLGAERVIGIDPSERSLEAARRCLVSEGIEFLAPGQLVGDGRFDLAFCNGVFHHIPPSVRADAVAGVKRALRPGGLFSFWENNPWNPGTRYVMSRIPFDRDAITLTPPEARRLLESGGFTTVRTDFLFIFPRALALLRPVERLVVRLPLGAQYQVLACKQAAAQASSDGRTYPGA
jgi:SAM-dependent methyltransferase